MDFIIADHSGKELGYMTKNCSIDMDIGGENDYEITFPLGVQNISDGYMFFAPGTEYGGFFSDPESNTEDKTITWTGDTFRGLLKYKVVEPPLGSDYLVLNGHIKQCMQTLMSGMYGSLFVVVDGADIYVSEHQVNRYVTLYDALEDLMQVTGCRLHIWADNSGDEVIVKMAAELCDTYTEDVEFSQDSNFDFRIKKKTNMYTHMLVAGKGELLDRQIVRYEWDGQNAVKIDAIPYGKDVKVYLYDNNNYESLSALRKDVKKKFKELNGTDEQIMQLRHQIDIEIGDRVSGRDYITGMTISEKVTRKIVKINEGKLDIEYTIGGKDG